MSSHQWLYPIFRFHGYRVSRIETDEQRLLLHVEPQPHRVCCPQCGSRDVIRRGQQVRWFRNLPVGADCTGAAPRLGPSPRAINASEPILPSGSRFWSFWKRFSASTDPGFQAPSTGPWK